MLDLHPGDVPTMKRLGATWESIVQAKAIQAAVEILPQHAADTSRREAQVPGRRRPLPAASLYTAEKDFYRRCPEGRLGFEDIHGAAAGMLTVSSPAPCAGFASERPPILHRPRRRGPWARTC